MIKALIYAVAAGSLVATSHAAVAGDSYHSQYKIVQFPITHNGKSDKVLFLDQNTGTLWSWSEAEGVSYLPGILRPGNPSGFARIIRVDPQ